MSQPARRDGDTWCVRCQRPSSKRTPPGVCTRPAVTLQLRQASGLSCMMREALTLTLSQEERDNKNLGQASKLVGLALGLDGRGDEHFGFLELSNRAGATHSHGGAES